MKKAAVFAFAALLWSQTPPPAPPANSPARQMTAAEMEAVTLIPPRAGKSETKKLFDGKSLKGWQGNMDWWSVRDGMIAGKASTKVPTSFLFSDEKYSDFRLTLMSRMVESQNHAGVAFWGEIAERGDNKWYTRGPLVIFPNPSMWDYNEGKGLRIFKTTTDKVTSQFEWIKVEILAQGNRVRSAFNGVQVMEWREADLSRVKEGPIGLQLHAWNEAQEVLYKDVVIETFPEENRLITLGRY
jgi:hypothetical protein